MIFGLHVYIKLDLKSELLSIYFIYFLDLDIYFHLSLCKRQEIRTSLVQTKSLFMAEKINGEIN